MVWAMLLAAMVIGMRGMIITKTVGQQCCEQGDAFRNPDIKVWFGTLPRSLFTLFQVMTLEGWPDIARACNQEAWWLNYFFIPYILFMNVTLLNTIASVIVENVLAISKQEEMAKRAKEEKDRFEE